MLRFLTIDPGHFHAALVQKEMYAGVAGRCDVYAPLGADLLAHLQRLTGFNARPQNPTGWQVDVHTGDDYLERALREKPGNVVVLAGKNARKIDYLAAAVEAGLHVLADKPWIIVPEHLPRLQAVLDRAERQGTIAYDIMTERFEITSILQKELIQDAAIFGAMEKGSADEPAVAMESVHFLKKQVAGAPLRRPPWFFDVHQQGEGLSDVGPHLVDIVPWMLFPEQPIAAERDLFLIGAKRWPTAVTHKDFQDITGLADFPDFLTGALDGGQLPYFCNTQASYTLRGIHVRLDAVWGLEAQPGAGDTHLAIFRGSHANVGIRQGPEESYRPELYVVPTADPPGVRQALERRLAGLQARFPGVGLDDQGRRLRVTIPDRFRTSHEAHFGEVTRQFLRYVQKEQPLPSWEKSNMLAKYWVTTQGVARARA